MKKKYFLISMVLILSLTLTFNVYARPLAATSPNLGAAESYSVLAGSIVTNTGTSTIEGNVGVSPSIGVPPHITGFPPGIIGPPGAMHDTDADAAAAQAANTAAFTSLDQGCDLDYGNIVKDLVGENLVPGVYCAGAFRLSGTLTLSGSGVWIFKSASDFVTSGTANVVGGNALDVWWRVVSSATLGTGTSLIGNILASTSISIENGATLNGRALAQTGAVTLDTVTIYGPICDQKTPSPTVTNTAQPAPTNTVQPAPTNTAQPGPTNTPVENGEEKATSTPLPVITALPESGGAPIRSDSSPWVLLVIASLSTVLLIFGVQAYRSTDRRKR